MIKMLKICFISGDSDGFNTHHLFQEAGPEGGKIQLHFEELLKNNTAIFVVSKTPTDIQKENTS